jgi:hypothetical protein
VFSLLVLPPEIAKRLCSGVECLLFEVLANLFLPGHLLGVIVVVGKGSVDGCLREVIPLGGRLGIEPLVLDDAIERRRGRGARPRDDRRAI